MQYCLLSARCIDLLPAPGLTFDTLPTTLSVGTQVTLKCSIPLDQIAYKDDIPSSTAWTFEWMKNGRLISHYIEDSLFTISTLSPDTEGRYECLYNIGRVHSAKSAELDITIRPLTTPVLTAPQADVSIGELVNLTCFTTSPGEKLYEWTLPSGMTVQTSEEVFSFQMTGWQNLGFFTCRVIIQAIASTSLSSTPFLIGLKLVTPLLNITGVTTAFAVNETVEFRCSTTDSSTFQWLAYNWEKDGVTIPGSCCTAELSLPVSDASIEGVYTCFIKYGAKKSEYSNEIAVQYKWSTIPTLQANLTTLSPGVTAEFMCLSAESGNPTFEILKGDQVTHLDTAQCSRNDISSDQQCWHLAADGLGRTGTYYCRVNIESSLSPLSNPVLLTKEDIETPTMTSDPPAHKTENHVTLNCTVDVAVAKAYPQLVYVFNVKTRNGTVGKVVESADHVLNITPFTSNDEGDYWCIVKNDWLLSNDSNILHLALVKYEVLIKSTAAFIPKNKKVIVTCSPSWNESASQMLKWFKDGKQINSKTERSIVIKEFGVKDAGEYSCQVYRTSPGEWVSSNTTALSLLSLFQICTCPCTNTTAEVEVTQDVIEETTSQIKEKLITKDTLSQKKRSKTSAEDYRTSSTACGGASIILLVVIIVFVIYIDGVNLIMLRNQQNTKKLRGREQKTGAEKYTKM